MRHICLSFIAILTLTACSGNMTEDVSLAEKYGDKVIAEVDGEILTEAEFQHSQVWMPAFARQLESNATLEISRFWSLVQLMRMAQDAQDKKLLSDAERSLAIKEALAKANIHAIPYPNYVIEQAEIDAYIQAHPEAFFEPMAFTVNYSLVKSESSIMPLIAGFGFAEGAQLGYNLGEIPPKKESNRVSGPQMSNEEGHFIQADKFNFGFTTWHRENTNETAQMGPFTAKDGLLFSCPKAIDILKTAPLNQPIAQDIACSGDWKAFVIPIWRRDVAPMTPEKTRQVAIENITAQKRAAFREQYIANLQNKSQQ